jgi:AraC-like DNA-binding protein
MTTPGTPPLAIDVISAAAFRTAYDAIGVDQRLLQERRREICAALRQRGATFREVAFVLGVSRSYARDLVTDPAGSARRARSRLVERRRAAAKKSSG